jgi:uncharacterized protein (TIGR02677 family)
MSEPRPFTHLDAPLADLYRQIMRVFVANKRRFIVHLRPEDVVDALRDATSAAAMPESIEKALASLTEWGNLRADPDTSRVTTVEDFYRARFLYQLSREGDAAERALETYESALGRRGELQAVALEDIRLRLLALRALPLEPDPARVHSLLLELSNRLDSLAENAGAFMASLQRTIDLQDVDEEAFLAYKDQLIAYLERFVSELVVKAYDIARTLRELDAGTVESLLVRAAEREAADVAPGAEGDDPREAKLALWRGRWSGLCAWFVGDRSRPSQASLLRQRARKAIPDLLATVSVLQERRAGRSDRSADFRTLARWFAEAPSEADAHRLWRAAFGLSPSRHLSGRSESEAEVAASTPWAQAPPVPVAARLRATAQYERRGPPRQVADRSHARELLARQVAAERVQTEQARRTLATGRAQRLSTIGALDREEFALFLQLLGEALSGPPCFDDGTIITRTGDGSFEIHLRPLRDGTIAEIITPDGVLRGPDHEVAIVDCGDARLEGAA